jgi:putative endonuclease
MVKKGFIYIVTNKNNRVLYTGVTSELKERIYRHKIKYYPNSFSSRYNCEKLVYFEEVGRMDEAIKREKQIKAGNRARKIKLIESVNPEWRDLYEEV